MVLSVLIFLLVLSILVVVHEFGHFWVAKKSGVWVEEFGFGLPPRIFGKRIGETVYSINLFPFGGFVRLHGEMNEEGVTNPNRAFLNKSKKKRVSIILAGVVMNFLLAVFAFAVTYSFLGIPKETENVKVLEIATNSPAQIGGLIIGDVVRKVDGVEIKSVDEFVKKVEEKKGKKTVLELGDRKVTLSPRESPPEGEGPLGVVISTTEIYFPPIWQRPFFGIYYGFKEAVIWGKNIFLGFANIITDLFRGVAPKDIAGPVGIFAVTSETAKFGIIALINFIGILSVNLAILNVLPFPALDGGRLLFIGIESILGRKVLPRAEAVIHSVGMIILLLLILLITISDIRKLIAAGSIQGFIESVVR